MIYEKIVQTTPIEKGWSGDKKYCAVTADGQKYLLRISSIERAERKKREFVQMQRVAELGIPMCLPIECGLCEQGFYSLQSFIEGEDAEPYIQKLTPARQYAYGLDAGKVL
ncbi:MAG: phosphotransferase, partial [Clostridia bacterium]|nr:phosphotransferase [Clostridia bacterium]